MTRWLVKVSCALSALALLLVSSPAMAVPILVTRDFGGGPPPPNDCAGLFGPNFGACDVGFLLQEDVSPIILKNNIGGQTEINDSEFPTVDGSEFSLTGQGGSAGTWTYTPGLGDPEVRYWVAAGGNQGFVLHWMVDDGGTGAPPLVCGPDAYNLACLNLALPVTSGNWSTLGGFGLSHISWYDTDGGTTIPEPVTLALFGVGLAGYGLARRRQKSR